MDALQTEKDIHIHKALLPLSWLYGMGINIRNKLFDWGIFRSEEFSVPVISIGNLSVGGTGKTPHTEFVIRTLEKKYRIAVLSRGYKRKSNGFVMADAETSSQKLGDEPYQMYRKFPEIIVAVDSNRRRGIKNLLQLPDAEKPEVILLDDAYQHRYVKPSLSILLSDFNRPFYKDSLLPSGRLREPWKNNDRANIIVCTKCPEDMRPMDYRLISNHMELYPYQDLFFSSFRYKSLLPVFPENNPVKKESLERLKKESYSFLLVAGLANPDSLIEYLQQYTSDLHSLVYPDHHSFTAKNIYSIVDTFNAINNNKKIIISSEKDAVRLLDNANIPDDIKSSFFYLPIEVFFLLDQESLFKQKIESHVKDFTRNRVMA
ncbi:MAG: tetraacyldisaccharide 4'-kinase [Bacteroidales bacterium]|nr:tetraacyldisaccharide 4'-kinase [Bacteroidales bacterium]